MDPLSPNQLDLAHLFETFNGVTILSSLVCGFLLGFLAFLPMIRLLVPDEGPRPPSPKAAFIVAYVVISVVLSVVLIVFYTQQIVGEIVAAILDPSATEPLWLRAVGRMLSGLVFIQALAVGVALISRREVQRYEELHKK